MGGRRESRISPPSPASLCYCETLARNGEIVDLLTCLLAVDDGTYRYRHFDAGAVTSLAIAAFAVTAALGGVLGIESEVEQSVVMLAGVHHYVAAAAAVTATGTTVRHVFLTAERENAISAVAGLHFDTNFIDKHGHGIMLVKLGGLKYKGRAATPAASKQTVEVSSKAELTLGF